jgi:3-hydroxyisobutyrate dehydrogenase-like beta-hydroxyacid dehydrogenase
VLQDLGLANNAAKETNSAVTLGQAALEIYTKMTEKGYGGKDFSVIFKILQDMSGPDVEKKKKEFMDQ